MLTMQTYEELNNNTVCLTQYFEMVKILEWPIESIISRGRAGG